MYGAIIGDILGSSYEFEEIKFDNVSPHTKSLYDIPLCIDSDHFTDDTVLTLAVMDWLLHDIKKDYYDDEALKTSLAKRFVQWTGFYRDREIAYGLSYLDFFYRAELIQEYIPQNSCGNGSAMRVSPVGWFFDTMEETLRFAKLSADVTHNHPEGQKGAMCIAAAVFLARHGKSKYEIRDYLTRAFGYSKLNKSVLDLRKYYERVCTCQDTVPESVVCFLESDDYESAIRLAISFGGDTDTMAAMSGSIAEAFYNRVPDELISYSKMKLTKEAVFLVEKFYKTVKTEA
jgi:ADP-ribosylglycohydrolase